jgi:hypothetical protein
MAYTPTSWVDNVTPVNAANLNKIETGVDQAHDALLPLPVVNGQWIKGSGGAAIWSAIAQADVTGLPAALTGKIDATIVDAKGDLIGASAADTPVRVPAGATDGHVLTRDAASAPGVKWAAPLGAAIAPGSTLAAGENDLAWAGGIAIQVAHYIQAIAASAVRRYGAAPAKGTELTLTATGAYPLTIRHNAASGTGAVFWMAQETDRVLLPGECASFFYDDNGGFWLEDGGLDGIWRAYTPYITQSVALGTGGIISARFCKIGKLVHSYGRIFFGTGLNPGTGYWMISLPVPVSSDTGAPLRYRNIGRMEVWRGGALTLLDCWADNTYPNEFGALYQATPGPGSPSTGLGVSTPQTWQSGDEIMWTISYEAA